MSQQFIDFGTFPDDPDADAIRTAFEKVQQNFNELFNTTTSVGVESINRTPGAGVTVSQPTGNVIISANIACVQFHTSTLSIGRGSNGGTDASITESSQVLWMDLPESISNVVNLDITGNANVGGNLVANKITSNTTLSVSGNANIGNIVTGKLTATGDITGANLNLTGYLSVVGNANVNNLGTGNITAGNVAGGNLVSANYFTGILNTASQPNITSLGTLTSLSVNGNANIGNIGTTGLITSTGNVNAGNFNTLGTVSASGKVTAGTVSYANTDGTNGQVLATYGNGVTYWTNLISGYGNSDVATFLANFGSNTITTTGNISAGNVSATNGTFSTIGGSLTTSAQPNITSIGTLTNISITGTANIRSEEHTSELQSH